MNVEKMNELMITAEDRVDAASTHIDIQHAQGFAEGVRSTMEKLGYAWYGRYRGGFRRVKNG